MLCGAWWLLRARRHDVQHAQRARVGRRLARPQQQGCSWALFDGGIAPGRDRLPELRGDRGRARRLRDIPAFGAPVELVWRQRRCRCIEPACPLGGFSEDHPLAPAQAKLTSRGAWWAISCIQRDNASVASIARRLGVDWHTVWDAIRPVLAELADDPARLAEVAVLGVDEHLWHHTPKAGKGPKELTGMVDLTRHDGRPQARLLDLVPGRSGKAYADWLSSRGAGFTAGVKTATLDLFRGYAVRHEARVIRVGWKDPPPGCRSSPVKLRAAGPVEVRWSGGKQP